MPLPKLDEIRPAPDALTRQEIADALGERYDRVYFWTARRQPPIIRPSYGDSQGAGHPAWFSLDDLDDLRQFFAALNTVQQFTGSRGPRNPRRRR